MRKSRRIRLLAWIMVMGWPLALSAATMDITNDTTIGIQDTNYDGTDMVVRNCTLTVDGYHAFGNFTVVDGGVLTHSGGVRASTGQGTQDNLTSKGLTLVVAGNFFVASGAAVNLDGKGYGQRYGGSLGNGAGRLGTGNGATIGSGAGHGGLGGSGASNVLGGSAYGDMMYPVEGGSAGGAADNGGSAGGGAIKLVVGGYLRVDGQLTANGERATNVSGGGASGGSVWLQTETLLGIGRISANGGDGEPVKGGGGSGGRMAIYSATSLFTGTLDAVGGNGFSAGAAGSVYIQHTLFPGSAVVIDNAGRLGEITVLTATAPYDLTVRNGGKALLPSATTLNRLTLADQGWLMVSNHHVWVLSEARIASGGGIVANSMGNLGSQGPGAGKSSSPVMTGGGGGFGGWGGDGGTGAAGGKAYGYYDSLYAPGSGGGSGAGSPPVNPGGAGGGLFVLECLGQLVLDGTITADGQAGLGLHSGGGSGGAIMIKADYLSGTGRISANGGAGNNLGGGGGGGRIMFNIFKTNAFMGEVMAYGGLGRNPGGAGTIYVQDGNQNKTQGTGHLLADNGSRSGAFTDVTGQGLGQVHQFTITRGAKVSDSLSGYVFVYTSNWLIESNGWMILSNRYITVTGDVLIQAGGGIIADGTGYPSGQGSGAGKPGYSGTKLSGSGGGYGGRGGAGATGAAGGLEQGNYTITAPTQPGSGGGSTTSYASLTNAGGSGGGFVRLTVGGHLVVDGRLSANGGNAIGFDNGGGSGGAIWLDVGQLSGSGVISANGGMGNVLGGGGGGGRIALNYGTNNFTGQVSAFGGAGYNHGGVGTLYCRSKQAPWGQLIVDDDGQDNPPTTLSPLGPVDLLVKGKVALATGSIPLHRLQVAATGILLATNGTITIDTDASVEFGGAIGVDGMGNSGPGTGRWSYDASSLGYSGGGGGHGGYGASASSNSLGGYCYDSLSQPTQSGGGGGGWSFSYYRPGGSGGGAVHLIVKNSLRLDGMISANGLPGLNPGVGGGAGGSIWLTAETISGTGSISANGGQGFYPGGGGGGGRIAVYFATNAFSGQYAAGGGTGLAAGGAGTVYLLSTRDNQAKVIIDNKGIEGPGTPLTSPGIFDLSVSGGAGAYPDNTPWKLNNLWVGPGGRITGRPTDSTLADLLVLGDAVIELGGLISVVSTGAEMMSILLPGNGRYMNGCGSGGGYGGRGGASLVQPGGESYGSATQPVDRGSSGGSSQIPIAKPVGSQGGGMLRLNVGGTLQINGQLNASGLDGVWEGAGGGSGGSIWITTGGMSGHGQITANGGSGEFYNGGGGGGGRMAIYCLTNSYDGSITVNGGLGYFPGENGSIYGPTNLPALAVTKLTPSGTISNAVSAITLVFNAALRPNSLMASNIWVRTPAGDLPPDHLSLMSLTSINSYTYSLAIPTESKIGVYTVFVEPRVEDLYGRSMPQAFEGQWVIAPLAFSGSITNENGAPLSGVTLRLDNGSAVMTDTNGEYAFLLAPESSGTITPEGSGWVFVPSSRAFTDLSSSWPGQDFLAMSSVAPQLSAQLNAANLRFSWRPIPGISYQVMWSTNLVDWAPYPLEAIELEGLRQVAIPTSNDPLGFFRLRSQY